MRPFLYFVSSLLVSLSLLLLASAQQQQTHGCMQGTCWTSCWDTSKWCATKAQCRLDSDCSYMTPCASDCIVKLNSLKNEGNRAAQQQAEKVAKAVNAIGEFGCSSGRCWSTCWGDGKEWCNAAPPTASAEELSKGKRCSRDSDCEWAYKCVDQCRVKTKFKFEF